MNIYIEVQITESEAKDMYWAYMEDCASDGEEPMTYEEFKETELVDRVSGSLSEYNECVGNYLEGDWLKIVEG